MLFLSPVIDYRLYQGQVGWGKSEPQFWSFWQSSISHSRVKSLLVSKFLSTWFSTNLKQLKNPFGNQPEYWPGNAKFLNCSWKASPCSFNHDPNIWTSKKSVPHPFSKKRNSCWLLFGFKSVQCLSFWTHDQRSFAVIKPVVFKQAVLYSPIYIRWQTIGCNLQIAQFANFHWELVASLSCKWWVFVKLKSRSQLFVEIKIDVVL